MPGSRRRFPRLTPEAALRGAEETIRAMEIQADAEYAIENLKFFLEICWPTLRPGVPFQDNWHTDCICEHLTALARRDFRKLIINISPRSLKSTILVAFRAWRWLDTAGIPSKGVAPGVAEKFLAASYGLKLAMRDSRYTRNLIKSQWYQARWGKRFAISLDQDEKGRFDNDKGGFSMIASVEGGVLGEGGSCLPGESRILTDRGELAISLIVKEKLPVKVLGSKGVWQNIRGYSELPGRDLLEFELENGTTLKCTENHPVWVDELGFIAASEVVKYPYAHLHLRCLRGSVRETGGTRQKSEDRTVLQSEMFRDIRDGGAQPRLGGRVDFFNLRILRRLLSAEAQCFPDREVLLEGLRREDERSSADTSESSVPLLRRAISPNELQVQVLQQVLCEFGSSGSYQRGGERQVPARPSGEPVRSWILGDAAAGNQGSGLQSVCVMPEDGDSSCPPHRRLENQPRPEEFGNSLYFVPPEGSHSEGDHSRLDGPVRIVAIRRCPAPDFVYNLDVAPRHDYYAEGVLTHNCRLIDDGNDLQKMIDEPETYPQSVRDWYSASMASRSIDPRTDVALCVQQRSIYGGDLTEYLEEFGDWEKCVIPQEWKGKTIIGPLAFPDPRTHLGELMFPARLGPEEVATLKREQKAHFASQYNQEPSIGGKNGLRREWFNFYNPVGTGVMDAEGKPRPIRITLTDGTFVEKIPVELPQAFEQIVHSWDMKFQKVEGSDFVAGHVWARIAANCFLLAREHGMWNFPETLAAVRRLSSLFACPEKLVENKANGPAVIDSLTNEIPGMIAVNPEGGKWSRVAAISGYAEAGNVYLPNPDIYPWVWDLLAEFASGASAKHDDDTDAMSQALKRLYDSSSRTAVPEFRVAPRLGEPTNAAHVFSDVLPPIARKFVAAVPGRAALWIAELRTGSLRVLRELSLEKLDATTAGREIGRRILPDLLARQKVRDIRGKQPPYEILLPKSAFAPVEPIGCWAELMEQSLLAFEPENGGWDERNAAREAFKAAHIRTEMVEDQDSSIDRLRGLLAFQPPDFRREDYDRKRAFDLADIDLGEYHRYMGMVDGKVVGEWPKLKFWAGCTSLIAELGTFRHDQENPPPFVEALLLGVSAPQTVSAPDIRQMRWPQTTPDGNRARGAMSRRFSMGRR